MSHGKRLAGPCLALGAFFALGAATAATLQRPDDPGAPRSAASSPASSSETAVAVSLEPALDARQGLAPLPPTAEEQAKLEQARTAIARAEADGTRWLRPAESPRFVPGPEAAAEKLARLRGTEPKPLLSRPGVPDLEKGGAR